MDNCEARDPDEPGLDEKVLELFLNNPEAFLAPCCCEYWTQEDFTSVNHDFVTTWVSKNGDVRGDVVVMQTKEDGTRVFPIGNDWVEGRVEIADRFLTIFVCADGGGQVQFAPDEEGPNEVRGMTYFEDARIFDVCRNLLVHLRERGIEIHRGLSH